MNNGDSYADNLEKIEVELKRIKTLRDKLLQEKTKTRLRFSQWMEKNNVKEYRGYKLEKIKPVEKKPVKRKPKQEKILDGIKYLRDLGVDNPEDAWLELQKTQKYE